MYSRCLVCGSDFKGTDVVEHVPLGERVAYDLAKGRLWIVCRSCRRWSLVPLEDRWEALEELEALVTGGGAGFPSNRSRLLTKTENISLFQAGPLEVVRIGHSELSEEAWWRYGHELERIGGMSLRLTGLTRWLLYGTRAWRGNRPCPGCGYVFTELPFSDRKILIVRPLGEASDSDSEPVLTRRCPRCKDAERGGLHLRGSEAEMTLVRVLSFDDHAGAPFDRVQSAVRLLLDPGGPSALVKLLTAHGTPLGSLAPIGTLALEMATVEARERALLRLDAEELEFRWRQEEELAELVDGDLTPLPLLRRFVDEIRGKS